MNNKPVNFSLNFSTLFTSSAMIKRWTRARLHPHRSMGRSPRGKPQWHGLAWTGISTTRAESFVACSRLRDSGESSRRHRPLSQVVRVLISLLISSHYVHYLRAWHRLSCSKLWVGLSRLCLHFFRHFLGKRAFFFVFSWKRIASIFYHFT